MTIDIEQVINYSKLLLSLNNTENDAVLEKFINVGARSLRTYDNYIVTTTELEIDDCHKAKLPSGFVEFLGARFTDSCSGCCGGTYGTTITEPGSIDTVYRPPCACPIVFLPASYTALWNENNGSCGTYGNYFTIEGDYIFFPSSVTSTKITICYRTLNIDGDGIMILNEDWERGLGAYAAYMYASVHFTIYPRDIRRQWQQEWVAQKMESRGLAQVKRSKLNKRAIWRIMNTLLWDGSLTGVYGTPYTNAYPN